MSRAGPGKECGNDAVRRTVDHAGLIAAIAQRGDREAFAALFAWYAPRVKAFLVKGGTRADQAEEIAQETMVLVWRKAALFDPARAGASSWIFAIARNLRIDAGRRARRERLHAAAEEPGGEEAVPPPDQELAAVERDARVRAALDSLPGDQRRVVELSFFEGTPHADIATRLGIPLGTVKSRLRLAMGRLRTVLSDLT